MSSDGPPGTETRQLVDGLLEGGFEKLFEEPEVKSACLDALAGVGCRWPANQFVFWLMAKAVTAGNGLLGNVARDKLVDLAERFRPTRRILQAFISLIGHADDETRRKQYLVAQLRALHAETGGIQVSQTTSLDILEGLLNERKLEEIDEHIRDTFVEISSVLRDRFAGMLDPALKWESRPADPQRDGVMAGLFYSSLRDDFIGRQNDLRILQEFLGGGALLGRRSRFSWLLLTGPGGEGKSRLAFELVRQARLEKWHAGQLRDAELQSLQPNKWRPRRPTLMVVDYAGQSAGELHRLLHELAQNAVDFDQPVRVLLLERDPSGDWFKALLPADNAGQLVRDHAYIGSPFHHQIEPLQPAELASLMRARIERAGLTAPSDEHLLSTAGRIDPRAVAVDGAPQIRPRPLFAAAIAEALIVAMHRDGKDTPEAWASALGTLQRNEVLDSLIEHDRTHVWRDQASDRKDHETEEQRLRLHERLLALTTMCLGQLTRDRLRGECPAAARDYLPGLRPRDPMPLAEDRLRRMGGLVDGRLGALEPNILGEHFVLSTLAAAETEERVGLMDAALALGGDAASVFLIRCVTDFGSHAGIFAEAGPLLSDARARLAFARAQANMLPFFGGPAVESVEPFFLAARRLATEHPDEAGLFATVAQGLANLASRGGPLVAPHMPWLARAVDDHPSDAALRANAVRAVQNFSMNAGEDEIGPLADWLQNLVRQWPDDAVVRDCTAVALANAIGRTRPQFSEPLLEWLRQLAEDHREQPSIRRSAASGVQNFTGLADAQTSRPHFFWLLRMATEYPRDPDVHEAVVRSAYHRSLKADCASASVMVALLEQDAANHPRDSMRQQLAVLASEDFVVRLEHDESEQYLDLLKHLAGAYPQKEQFRELAAYAAKLRVESSMEAGQPDAVRTESTWLGALLAAYPEEPMLQRIVASAAGAIIFRSKGVHLDLAREAMARLKDLVERQPTNDNVRWTAATAVANILGQTDTEEGLSHLAWLRQIVADRADDRLREIANQAARNFLACLDMNSAAMHLPVLWQLAADHPDDVEVAKYAAKATIDDQMQQLERGAPDVGGLEWLKALAAQGVDAPALYPELARVSAAYITHYAHRQEFDHAAGELAWLHNFATVHADVGAICTLAAMATNNVIASATAERSAALATWLRTIAREHLNDAEILGVVAQGVFNQVLNLLQDQDPQDAALDHVAWLQRLAADRGDVASVVTLATRATWTLLLRLFGAARPDRHDLITQAREWIEQQSARRPDDPLLNAIVLAVPVMQYGVQRSAGSVPLEEARKAARAGERLIRMQPDGWAGMVDIAHDVVQDAAQSYPDDPAIRDLATAAAPARSP